MPVRWIGFDMDECIGSVMPLYEYVVQMPFEKNSGRSLSMMYNKIAEALYESEHVGYTWLVRPAVREALKLLYDAYSSKKVYGAFVYSNNGSSELVTFVAFLMNVFIKHQQNLTKVPLVFKMAVWQGAPCRPKTSYVKSYASVQTCLKYNNLPECTSKNDLMFFDDMEHVLQKEIPHYVQVPPYFNHTPATHIIQLLLPILSKHVDDVRLNAMVKRALTFQMNDFRRADNQYKMIPPSRHETERDVALMRAAFSKFLG